MGDYLNNYEKIKVIGHGSYGEVWLVKHKSDKREYVLKKLDLSNASAKERRGAEQECRLLSQLKHPNIVTYKESFETTDGFLYISMRYCEAGDLYTKLKQQKGKLLEEKQIVEWFIQIAMALRYMHSLNIMHRDLKTQNIFLTRNKIIKLGDLGIARVLDSSGDMAKTLIGTPYYMSPEIFSNRPYNFKSDVWALGCCVFEMVTLKHAFNGKDLNSLMYQIHRGRLPPMPEAYSTQLKSLIKVMMRKEPERRPSVDKILKDAFIQKHIAIFLKETRKSQVQKKNPASKDDQSKKTRTQSSNNKLERRKSEEEVLKVIKYPLELEAIPEESSGRSSANKGRSEGASDGEEKSEESEMNQFSQREVDGRLIIISHSKSDPSLSRCDQKSGILERFLPGPEVAVENERDILNPDGNDNNKLEADLEVHRPPPSSVPKVRPHLHKISRPLPQLHINSGHCPTKNVLEPIPSSSNPVRYQDNPGRNFPGSSSSSSSSSDSTSVNVDGEKVKQIDEFSIGIPGSTYEEGVLDSARPDTARSGARERRRQRVMNENIINIDVAKSKLMMSSSGEINRCHHKSDQKNMPTSHDRPSPSSSSSSSSSSLTSVSSSSLSSERRKSDPDTKPGNSNMPLSLRLASSDKILSEGPKMKCREGYKESERKQRRCIRFSAESGYENELNASSPTSSDSQTPEEFLGEEEIKSDEKEFKKFLHLLGTLTLRERRKCDDNDYDHDDDDGDEAEDDGANYRGHKNYIESNKIVLENNKDIPSRSSILFFDSGVGDSLNIASTGVLYDRISNLRRDCLKGLGMVKLKKAYEILDRFDEEDIGHLLLEVLGQSDFDDYAGKIMQLKYYEDTVGTSNTP